MKINNIEYNFTPLNVFEVFEVARVLAPVLTFMSLQRDREQLRTGFPQAFCGLVQDYDKSQLDRIWSTCLSHVTRRDGDGYAPIYVNGQVTYSDIDILVLLSLLWEVIVVNKILDFYAAPPLKSTGVLGDQVGSTGSASQTARAG